MWPRLAILAATTLLLAAAPAGAQEPTVPAHRGFVNDFAGVLDGATARHLEELITELQRKTTAEIAVVTVRTTGGLTAFDYAMKIAEAWKPGAADADNGLVFLVAVEDRQLYIATGYGLEGALPDGLVGQIRDQLIAPRFREGDYGAGIRAGTEGLAELIARENGVSLDGLTAQPRRAAPPAQPRRRPPFPNGGVLVLLLLVVLLSFLLPRRRGFRRMHHGPFFGGGFGGGGFGGGGGGFGGFGGGRFGGGGAGGGW